MATSQTIPAVASSLATSNPTSQTAPAALPPNVFTLKQTAQLEALYTIICDKDTRRGDFIPGELTGRGRSEPSSEDGYDSYWRGVGLKGGWDEQTAPPKLFFSKLPEDIATRYVLLLDPMLATGGSAMKAVEVLKAAGVLEERTIFVNLVSTPQISVVGHVITGWVDRELNEKKFILPGLGDFGERSYVSVSPVGLDP